jgi:hypothetical protein
LRESWRHMGCCKERVFREKDVGGFLFLIERASASVGALLLRVSFVPNARPLLTRSGHLFRPCSCTSRRRIRAPGTAKLRKQGATHDALTSTFMEAEESLRDSLFR